LWRPPVAFAAGGSMRIMVRKIPHRSAGRMEDCTKNSAWIEAVARVAVLPRCPSLRRKP